MLFQCETTFSDAAGVNDLLVFLSVNKDHLCRIARLYLAVAARCRLSERESLMPQFAKWASLSRDDSSFDSPLFDMYSANRCLNLDSGAVCHTFDQCSLGQTSELPSLCSFRQRLSCLT